MQEIYFREFSLEAGQELLLSSGKGQVVIQGTKVSIATFWKGRDLLCHICNSKADRWIAWVGSKDTQVQMTVTPFIHKNGALHSLTKDHIVPVSLGGINHTSNYRAACASCNSLRGNEIREDRELIRKNLHNVNVRSFKALYRDALKKAAMSKKLSVRNRLLAPYREMLQIIHEAGLLKQTEAV
jgi:hypothetical protein